ncbi:MAG: hypothetical protein QXG39_06200 [Candidatus Aenigmatarchaeota archaeon]|nr:hypothetical protein [Candidatus Bathyarchaeota archaeon]
MVRTTLKRELEKFLYCSGLLEERVAKAYEHIVKLVDDKPIGCLLSFIARDSFKHAECFKVIGECSSGNMKDRFEQCEQVWGETWKNLVVDAEKFLSKRRISHEELVSLINGLMKLESFAAEEYLTVLHVKLIELMAEERKIDLEPFKAVLEWIVEDEKRHEQILRMIENLLIKRESRKINGFSNS